ncbi:RICIN domain-containing protein [Streptomyces virginiae]|uniref:RICIN domain-containing protein n=1 Tax=Streptomyces virginiae TaxID=1961 RepID=UPI002255DECF|nr:RICIN domain-containing protein [Streptomyces virginiae]MCX5175394.1 RICIN domain-containing protein [Streptomyces virginiae]
MVEKLTARSGSRRRRSHRLVVPILGSVIAMLASVVGIVPAESAIADTGLSVSSDSVRKVAAGTTVPVGHIYVAGDSSKTLDMYQGRTDTGHYANVYGKNSSNPSNQQFRLYTMSDGSFQIRAGNGNCLQAATWWDSWNRIRAVTQESCDSSNEHQLWAPTPRSSAADNQTVGYQIKNVGSGNCMDYLTSWPEVNSANWVDDYECRNTANQTWAFDSSHQSVLDSLAVQYQIASVCGGATSSSISSACTFTETGRSIASGPGKCVGTAWYNEYDKPVTESYSTTTSLAYSDLWGVSLSVSEKAAVAPFGVGFELTLTQQFNYSHTETSTRGETFTTQVPIDAGKYGWVVLSQPIVRLTGYWTFGAGTSQSWTLPVTQDIPAASETGGFKSIVTARQGDKLPTTCSAPVPATT